MTQPLVSVVVPVYQAEAFLEPCVRSLTEQTCRALEILLVDDGSTDQSPALCDAWAQRDARIRVLHLANGGPAAARNAGTRQARGAYITYVDSDDWVFPDMVEALLSALRQNDAQVAVCGYVSTDGKAAPPAPKAAAPQLLTGRQAMEAMLYQKAFDTCPWAKMYAAELIRACPYPPGRLHEDLFTTYKVLFAASTVVYLPQKLYCYRIRPESVSRRAQGTRLFDAADAADEIAAFVSQNCPELLPAANARRFSTYSQVLRGLPDGPLPPALQSRREALWAFIKGYRRQMLLDGRARAKNRIAAALSVLGPQFYRML